MVRVRIRVRVRLKIQLEVMVVVWLVWFDLVWNDDVCIWRARSAADSDILVSAKLQLYLITIKKKTI